MGPVVAPFGTWSDKLVSLQLVALPIVPLNLTLLSPCVVPKLEPVIVTRAPIDAVAGVTFVILNAVTAKFTVFDHTPPCNTCATPVSEPETTDVTICVSLQLTTTPYVLPSHTLPLP
jgi:hypothetical protein